MTKNGALERSQIKPNICQEIQNKRNIERMTFSDVSQSFLSILSVWTNTSLRSNDDYALVNFKFPLRFFVWRIKRFLRFVFASQRMEKVNKNILKNNRQTLHLLGFIYINMHLEFYCLFLFVVFGLFFAACRKVCLLYSSLFSASISALMRNRWSRANKVYVQDANGLHEESWMDRA